jgi:hypothetical protein
LIAVKDEEKMVILARKYPRTVEVSEAILMLAEQASRIMNATKQSL